MNNGGEIRQYDFNMEKVHELQKRVEKLEKLLEEKNLIIDDLTDTLTTLIGVRYV
jgi:uncharacterized protein (UPF0335 family)